MDDIDLKLTSVPRSRQGNIPVVGSLTAISDITENAERNAAPTIAYD